VKRKLLGSIVLVIFLANVFLAVSTVDLASAPSPPTKLTLKWTRYVGANGKTQGGPLVSDLTGDGKMEVVVTGAVVNDSGWTTDGSITVLDGATGNIVWKRGITDIPNNGIDPRTPFDIADIDKDGKQEIVIYSYSGPLVLFANGSVYWRRIDVPGDANYGAVSDVNGDGYAEIFTCGGETPYMANGTDHIASLTYDGTLLYETPSWHPCFGGLSVADPAFDGHFLIYEGDRSSSYAGGSDLQKYGGWGVRALDALTLTPVWNDSDILCSSQCPVLADVDNDGKLDVVIAWQSGGMAVLNALNGSVVTNWNGTGGYIYRKTSSLGLSSHSQLTVCDIDGDGHLEALVCGHDTPLKIWDLYDWRLKAILPLNCWEPPRVGYVTGDGKLDIIAVNSSAKDIHIYSYDNGTNTYNEVDNATGLTGANSFTCVQDVDGDDYNELVVSTYAGWVYCYGTPAKAANPRPRSGLQFYSEYKRGVGEYVLPAGPQAPVISDPFPGDKSSNIPVTLSQLNFTVTDFQQNLTSYTVLTSPDIGSGIGTNKVNGRYSVPINNLSYNTTYSWTVTATDGQNSRSKTYTFTSMPMPPWWNTSWHYRRTIVFDSSKISGNQTDFPVVIDLTDGNLTSRAQTNGNDFVFVDANNTKLNHEIEQYDPATGHLVVWVKIPFLSESTSTILFMYYGNSVSGNQQNVTGVWDSSNRMVLHLDEKTGTQYDSTANGNNGAPLGGVAQGVAGKIDGADNFDGVNDYLQVPSSGTLSGFTQAFTASFWLRLDDTTRRQAILNKFNTVAGQEGWFIEYNGNLGLFASPDGNTYGEWHASFSPTAGTWYYITVVWQTNAIPLFYVNGIQKTTTGTSKIASIYDNTGVPLYVGRCAYNSARYVKGGIDEIRISNPARSTGWVLTSYNNQQNPSTFYYIDQGETLPNNPFASDPTPSNGAQNVSVLLTELSFNLTDYQNDPMNFTLTTTPNIGSSSQTNVPNGRYHVPIFNIQGYTTYTWTVNVTDGTNTATSTYIFTTGAGPAPVLNVNITGNGTVSRNDTGPYTYGSAVQLTAVPDSGWIFQQWTGDLNGSQNPATIIMAGNKSVTAVFVQSGYTLFITTNGSGSVSKVPDYATYAPNTNVTLTATAIPGWTFFGWSGDLSGSSNPISINMTSNKSVTATFTQDKYKLTVNVVGGGSVNAVPNQTNYTYGTIVTLTASASSGWTFANWTGDLTGFTNSATLNMTSDKSVTATFIQGLYTLTVNTTGSGSVSKNNTGPYNYGDQVALTATPSSGWDFNHWSGDLTGSKNPNVIFIDGNKSVSAIFTLSTSPPWWNSSWQYRRPITINHQKVSSDQTNFPVVVDLTDSGLKGKAQTSGNDFVFVDANNAKLNHEIEQYDPATGHLVVWVRVPTLSSTIDTVIYMYYGNPSCPSQQNKTAVWDINYLMIMHLDEKTGTQYDSTSNQNNGTSVSPLSQGATGKIDGCDDFPGGSTGGYVQAPRVCTTQTQFTFSAWIYPRSGSRYFISEWWNNQGAFLQINMDNAVQFYVNGLMVSMPVSLNQWHYVVATYNGTYMQLWLDGGFPATASVSVPTWPSQSLYVGDRSDHLRKFNGLIDEVRVSNVARSGSWVNAEYNNQKDPSTFYTIGTEQAREAVYYTLTISVVGNGSVSADPDQATYAYNTTVQLTAVAGSGWTFSGWSGDSSGSSNPISVNVTGNMVVTATFSQNGHISAKTQGGSVVGPSELVIAPLSRYLLLASSLFIVYALGSYDVKKRKYRFLKLSFPFSLV
jgi:uncharacterized repeat protein (TIGR02543 family)